MKLTRTIPLIAAFAVILFFAQISTSFAIYQWVDDQGNVHITDYPKPGSQQPTEEEKAKPELQPLLPESAAPESAPSRELSTESQKKEIQKQPAVAAPQTPAPQPALAVKPTPTAPPVSPQQIKQNIASSPVQTTQPLQTHETPTTAVPASPGPPAPGAENVPPQKAIAAFMAAFAMFILAGIAALYIYGALCLFLIAGKLNVSVAWMAWVPILNIWPLIASAGKPCWWVLLFFIPFVNFIVGIYLWMCITENLGRGKAQGLLMLIPVVNLVFLGVLAFSKKANA